MALKNETLVCVALVVLAMLASSLASSIAKPNEEFYEDDSTGTLDELTRNDLARFLSEQPAIRKLIEDNRMHDKLLNYGRGDKNKRDDDLPPGFIGVRGRRGDMLRMYRNYLENVASAKASMLAPQGDDMKNKMIKKSNAYKDGFLGVRG